MENTLYRVELDVFSGPLDLLLYLVRRNELDVLDLPIAPITAQFQEYLQVLELIDLDFVGDFVVMASSLVEIKSRLVLPRPEEHQTIETEEDPRSDLIQQLLEYKKFKDAAHRLEEQAAEWQERYPRLSDDRPQQGKDHSADHIKEVELWDLVSALARVVQRTVIEKETSIRYDDTPIRVYVDNVGRRVRAEGRTSFSSLFEEASLRSKVIGLFLAVLELLRHHGFRAEQSDDFGEIWILPPIGDPSEVDADGTEEDDTQDDDIEMLVADVEDVNAASTETDGVDVVEELINFDNVDNADESENTDNAQPPDDENSSGTAPGNET